MSEDEKFEQQSFFTSESEYFEKKFGGRARSSPLLRDTSDISDEKEGKLRYFERGTCVKMYENERTLLFLQSDVIARHANDGKRDKEGFERFYFLTNAEFQGKKTDYVRAARGKFSVVFNLNPNNNVLWIKAKDGSIRRAKKYLKENRIAMSDY